MKHKEVEMYRKQLVELVDKWHPTTEPKPEDPTKGDFQKLARKVGASTRSVDTNPATKEAFGRDAGIGELIDNIHQALQTASMIDACRTAAMSFGIALAALGVSFASVLVALIIACSE